jgi:ribosomal protein S18 acetylase RimI-like enzyme
MPDVRVERLPAEELERIREIDRSETVDALYVREGSELRRTETRLEIPPWDDAAIARIKARLAPKLAAGGVLLGALDGAELVGAAVLSGQFVGVPPNQLEVAFLYVDSGRRGVGIGRRLLDELCRIARSRGAQQLYVSASDTESAVGFYLRYGAEPADRVEQTIAAENEPTDIQLTLRL